MLITWPSVRSKLVNIAVDLPYISPILSYWPDFICGRSGCSNIAFSIGLTLLLNMYRSNIICNPNENLQATLTRGSGKLQRDFVIPAIDFRNLKKRLHPRTLSPLTKVYTFILFINIFILI